jgi:hypothetical protein
MVLDTAIVVSWRVSTVLTPFLIFLSVVLVSSVEAGIHGVSCQAISYRANTDNDRMPEKIRNGGSAAAEKESRRGESYNSGIKGMTKAIVMSGIPGGQNTERFVSIEFAIAPVVNGKPDYAKAVFVRSDQKGEYKLALPPGRYWIGPKAKALNPEGYAPPDSSFSEQLAVVKEGVFTQIDLAEIKYAP